MNKLFTPHNLADIQLKNRVGMAPMTRTRTLNDVADELVALYYSQRASAGLIMDGAKLQMQCMQKVDVFLLNFGMWDECHMFQCYLKIKHQYHLELFQQLTLQYLRILILENLVRLHQAFLEH